MSKVGRVVHYRIAGECWAAVVVKDWGGCQNLHVFDADPYVKHAVDMNPTSVPEAGSGMSLMVGMSWHGMEDCK